MAKRAKRKAHSEVRWVMKYTYTDVGAKPYFGQMLVRDRDGLASMLHGKPTRVRVTEILPTPKRKAKR